MPKKDKIKVEAPSSPNMYFGGGRYNTQSVMSPTSNVSRLFASSQEDEIFGYETDLQSKQPLVQKSRKKQNCCKKTCGSITPGSLRSSIFNLCATAIGTGVLSLPYQYKLSGMIPGIIAMFFGAIAAIWSLRLIVSCSVQTNCTSLSKITKLAGGQRLASFLDIMVMIYIFGVSVTSICINQDLIVTLLNAFEVHIKQWPLKIVMIIISALVLFPISLFRNFSSLRFTTLLSVGAIAILVLAILIKSPQFAIDKLKKQDILLYKIDFNFFQVIGTMFFSFTCHLNLLPIYQELKNPLSSRINKIIIISIVTDLVFYLIIATAGYLSFLSQTGQIVTEGGGRDVLYIIARIAVIIPVTFSVPVNFISLKASLAVIIERCGKRKYNNQSNIESIVGSSYVMSEQSTQFKTLKQDTNPNRTPKLTKNQYVTHFLITTTALLYSNVTSFIGILGGIFSVGMCYLIPMMIYQKLMPYRLCSVEKLGSLIFGIIITLLGLLSVAASVRNIINGPPK